MNYENQRILYNAPAVLHELDAPDIARPGVQITRGGPIDRGSFANMIKRGLKLPLDRARNTSITIDKGVVGEETWLNFEDYSAIAERSDFPI